MVNIKQFNSNCLHPYYFDGFKGYCGKPYREVKEKWRNSYEKR